MLPPEPPRASVDRLRSSAARYAVDALGLLLSAALLVTPSPLTMVAALVLVWLLLEELNLLFIGRYIDPRHVVRGVALGFLLLATVSLFGFLVLQYGLGASVAVEIAGTSAAVFAAGALTKWLGIRRPTVPSWRALGGWFSSLRFDAFAIAVTSLAFAFFFLAFYSFTYGQPPSTFMFGDTANYLISIRGFLHGGVSLTNAGDSLVGQASFVYTSSSLTISSWFFELFGAQARPAFFYVLITGIYGALFVGGCVSVLSRGMVLSRKVALAGFTLAGFSLIGVLWIWFLSLGIQDAAVAPAFFQGTAFPLGQSSRVFLEGAMSDTVFKAAWHGPAYLSFVAGCAFYLSEGLNRRSVRTWTFLIVTLLAYSPLGVALAGFLVWAELAHRLRIDRPLRLVAWIAAPAILLRAVSYPLTFPPGSGLTLTPRPFDQITGVVVGLLIFAGAFLVLLSRGQFRRNFVRRIESREAVLPLTVVVLSSAVLLFFTTTIVGGGSDDYLWGFTLSLGLLVSLPLLFSASSSGLGPSLARPPSPRPPSARPGRTARWWRLDAGGLSPAEVATVSVALLLVLPAVIYSVQPVTSIAVNPNPQYNQALYVSKDVNSLASWMTQHLPQSAVFMAPPALWYLPALTGKQLLAETFEGPASSPQAEFVNRFYAPTFSSHFNRTESLTGWSNGSAGNGLLRITSLETLNGSPVLEVSKQNYSQAGHSVLLPLANAFLTASVYPVSVPHEPDVPLGIYLRLDSGYNLAFIASWSSNLSNTWVDPLSWSPNTWNYVSVNVTQFAEGIPQIDVASDTINQILLFGGTGSTVYWGGVALSEVALPMVHVVLSLEGYGVSDVVFNNTLANAYVGALLGCGGLATLATFGPWSIGQLTPALTSTACRLA